jgi:hypothetical protein
MQAMMAARPVARVVPPEETVVADLVARHGDKALLVEARHGADGRPKLLAVLDVDQAALTDEVARLSSSSTVAVDVIDRPTWLTMRRLATSGLLQFTHESRVLHRSAALNEEGAESSSPDERSAQLLAEAQRSLGMAKVLASGGFPEEAPALLARVLQKAAAARMAERAELPTGATAATDMDIRRLIEQDVLPADALAILDASQPSAGPQVDDDIKVLIAAAEQFLAAITRPVAATPTRRAA